MEFAQHISHRFNEDLEGLRSRVLAMGGLVEEQVAKALDALVNGDSQLGLQVAHDDDKVNEMEVAIDEECNRVLARRSPTASDLRLIVAIIKTITDLERIGDEAEKIGFLASRLASVERPSNNYREIRHLGRHVGQMVRDSLDAFARLDTESAVKVIKSDSVVDEEYELISRQSITFMMEDPRTIRRVLDVLWAARALERVGDHAKNICEYVVFMVQGEDVRHTGLSHLEKTARESGDG
ncbi:MAG TPA: phosphate signaling complex protein PhoU [Gammaproteobacteria bacterium]|nr:phosphate signaling complex protein PhoU [Gammaproteobacteria bacterium]